MLSTGAHADLILDWGFTNSGATIAADATVELQATITNSSLSDQSLALSQFYGAGISYGDKEVDNYSFSFGSISQELYEQFAGIVLNPGESFNFVYGTLSPLNSIAESGLYNYFDVDLKFGWDNPVAYFANNDFTFSVASTNVSEPGSAFMLMLGLVAVFAARKKAIA